MKNALQEIVYLILQLSDKERKSLVRLLRQLEDKHWEDYL